MSGKGSRARPLAVPKEEFDKSFENIFGKYVPPYLRNRTEEKEQKDDNDIQQSKNPQG